MKNKSNEKKEILLNILSNAKSNAQNLTSKARQIVAKGQEAVDLASYNEDWIRLIPDDSFYPQSHWDDQIKSWTKFSDNAHRFSLKLEGQQILFSSTDSSSMATSSMM